MKKFTIYHNPRCSKSRQALEILNQQGAEVQVIEYLKSPPTRQDLLEISRKLGQQPLALIRSKESVIEAESLDVSTNDAALDAMINHPVLLERPIVIHGDRAVIARPPERLLELL